MKSKELTDQLFLRGWFSPRGCLAHNNAFEVLERNNASSLLTRKDAFYPVTDILQGGAVDKRVLMTSDYEDTVTVEIQKRSETGWVTETFHSPEQFSFMLSADPSCPGSQPEDIKAFMKYAQENGFDTCIPHKTVFGKLTLGSRENGKSDVFLQLDATESNEKTSVHVMRRVGSEMVNGALQGIINSFALEPPIKLEQIPTPEGQETLSRQVQDVSQYKQAKRTFREVVRDWLHP